MPRGRQRRAEARRSRGAFFRGETYGRKTFDELNADGRLELLYLEPHLTLRSVAMAEGFPAVCIFVNDRTDAGVIAPSPRSRVKLIALRSSTGSNNVDLEAATASGITVV